MLLVFLLLWFVVSGTVIFLYARRDMVAAWCEPVLLRPVMIIESDDWGAGPAEQATVLGEIKNILEKVRDADGRHPVMTLGMILATPDAGCGSNPGTYSRQVISDDTHSGLLDVVREGERAGVFTIHLHGLEHYWPATLQAVAQTSDIVSNWLQQSPDVYTETLPAHLQSRWIDATVLPSRPLPADETRQAVAEEVTTFASVFGGRPVVAVPPTFVWNNDVEQAWAGAGIKVVVTPGRKIEGRDADGRPVTTGSPVYNGQTGLDDIVYMVRDVYFEPSLGHTAEQALDVAELRLRTARPALFETHRFNFIGPQAKQAESLKELESLLRGAVKRYPGIAFLSTEKLADILRNRSNAWVEQLFMKRLHVWIERLAMRSRLRKIVFMSGWGIPVWLLWKVSQ